MKKIIFGIFLLTGLTGNTQFNIESIKNKPIDYKNSTIKVSLTNDEIVEGLKEALNVGVD